MSWQLKTKKSGLEMGTGDPQRWKTLTQDCDRLTNISLPKCMLEKELTIVIMQGLQAVQYFLNTDNSRSHSNTRPLVESKQYWRLLIISSQCFSGGHGSSRPSQNVPETLKRQVDSNKPPRQLFCTSQLLADDSRMLLCPGLQWWYQNLVCQ